jgi:hypothetical protein
MRLRGEKDYEKIKEKKIIKYIKYNKYYKMKIMKLLEMLEKDNNIIIEIIKYFMIKNAPIS